MAQKKSTQDSDNNSQSSPNQSTQSTQKRNPLVYVAVIVVIFVVIGVAVYYFSKSGGQGQSVSTSNILSNLSSSNLNTTQQLFVSDLERSQNDSSLQVSFYSSNATEHVQSGNETIAISSNQTIDSYKAGNQNVSVQRDMLVYTNEATGQVLAKNITALYYYNISSNTITCYNQTTYTLGAYGLAVSNATLQCQPGDGGLSYLEEYPFRPTNVSSIAVLVNMGNITYKGSKTVMGRSCDDFILSNATSANLLSNYSTLDVCIDKQYGIPISFNETDVVGGVPQKPYTFVATSISSSVSASDFVIPSEYLSNVSQSII